MDNNLVHSILAWKVLLQLGTIFFFQIIIMVASRDTFDPGQGGFVQKCT